MRTPFLLLIPFLFAMCNRTPSKVLNELSLDDVNGSWVLQNEHSKSAVPQLDLYFNYPVSPKAVNDKLKIEIDGQPVNYTMQSLADNSQVSLRLNGVAASDKDIETRLIISEGLSALTESKATAPEIKVNSTIASPFNLVINDVAAEHDGLSGTLFVRTSQPVVMDGVSSLVSIEPAVKFSIDKTENGFQLRSQQFDAEKNYQIKIDKGLRGLLGGTLQEAYSNTIAFGDLEPSISFTTTKSVFLSSKGSKTLDIRLFNVEKIKVVISKIYESNLLAAQQYGYYPSDKIAGEEEYYYNNAENNLTTGDIIYEQEIDARSLPQIGNSRLYKFNFEDKLADFKGIYHIKVRSVKDYWLSDSRFISVSDIGLIAKEGQDKLFVFTNSIKSTEAIAGVNVVAYGSNNQVLGMGTTNADGVAEIGYTRTEFAGFKPAMIIAKRDNDFNYLPFRNTKVNTSRFETGGKINNPTGLDAFIYGERDIYRPGEQINFSVVVRDRQWKSPGEIPLIFTLHLPNGKEFKTLRKTLNAQGSAEGNIAIPVSAITGSYNLEVFTSNEILLGNTTFNIEEFVPDRIKVTSTLNKPSLQAGDKASLSINAVNFFGPPAANRNYETEIQLRSKNFRPTKYSNYNFEIENAGLSLDKVVREGKTDQQGNAVEVYEVPAMFKNNGLLQANFYTTVFDETGRPVSRYATANVFTQAAFFGIADDGNWYYTLNQPIKFPVVAVDKNEQLMNGVPAAVKMIKHEYKTVLSKSGSYFRYESQQEDKVLDEKIITVSGESSIYSFVPRSPGNYELRISIPGSSAYVSKKFYSYGAWGGENSSFEVNTDGNIDIETDKSIYKPGETAKILFKTPFNGRLLVTTETDRVISYQYVNVEKRNASIDLKIAADHLPNFFVTATLIKPHSISDIPLTVAHGFQNVKVEDKGRISKVEIIAAKASRSKTTQQVTVKTDPGSLVTLAAVDNGVLQVSDFKTPDPYHFFYAPRALDVEAYDLYPFLFPEVRARMSSTGGDGMDMQKRTNPMPAKRVQIVSYWSGIAKADGSGQAKFNVKIPQFSGAVRLMAVAYNNNKFGSSEASITVADPLVISTALPRFLSPGDTVSVPVTITNTTGRPTDVKAALRVTGPLKIVGAAQQSAAINSNSEQRLFFSITSTAAIDSGRVVVEAAAMNEKFVEETAIGVRPASPLQVQTGSGSINGTSTQNVAIDVNDFMQGSLKYKLVLSRNPLLEIGDQLKYLVQYPYGCTEQVISAAFPQLYYADLAAQFGAVNNGVNANDNVAEAMRRIKLRQLYNGAVTLWDGEGNENWWSSIYAAHFLIEAQKAGFDTDKNVLSGLLNYINARLRNKQAVIYYYNRDQQKKIAPKEVAYSLYVLSLANRPNISAMNYYKANLQTLSLDSKYLLSVAYSISGDKRKSAEILPASFSGEVSVPQTGGSFYSPIRDEAIALNGLIEADPDNRQIPLMARHVVQQLKERTWYSTQESSFSFLALGKLAKEANKSTITADIKVKGKKVAEFGGKDLTLSAKQLGGNEVILSTSGQGRLYYYWQSEGISSSGRYREEDNYIRIRRQFFDRYGRKVDNHAFRQNDLVIVQLTLEKLYSSDVENIAITDILPAGFEIENPRTKEIPGMDWVKDAASPKAIDVRDDRLNLFVDLVSGRQVYYYAARAVSPGTYHLGPVGADAMYNGEYHSYNGAGKLVVQP